MVYDIYIGPRTGALYTERETSLQAAQTVLLGNDVLTQLAEAYSCSERNGAHLLPHPKQAGRTTIGSKIKASCFSAYFGLVWQCVLDGSIPGIALLQYFENLLSDEVCPNLRALIKQCQQGRSLRRNGETPTPQEEDDGTKMDWSPAEIEQGQYEKGKEKRSDEKKGKEKGKQKQKQGATADQRSAPQKAEQTQQVVQNARPSAHTVASAPVPEPGPIAAQQEENDSSEMDWSPTIGQNNGIGFSICCQCT